jgi:hypothetical protein
MSGNQALRLTGLGGSVRSLHSFLCRVDLVVGKFEKTAPVPPRSRSVREDVQDDNPQYDYGGQCCRGD